MSSFAEGDGEDDWIPIVTAYGRISRETLPANLAVSFLYGALAEGLLPSQGIIRRVWQEPVEKKQGTKNNNLLWGKYPGPVRNIPIDKSFWRNKVSSESFRDGVYSCSFEDLWYDVAEDDGFVNEYRSLILKDIENKGGSVSSSGDPAKISDVQVKWSAIEVALKSPVFESRYSLEGYSAVFGEREGRSVYGRPRKSDDWTEWYCEVMELFLKRKFGKRTTANNLVETVAERANEKARNVPAKSSTYPVAQAIVERVRGIEGL